MVRVRSLAFWPTAMTSSIEAPDSALENRDLKTKKSPAMPRRS